jgi:hypothetical protein
VTARYRPFDGDAWVGRDIALAGGLYRVLAEDTFVVAGEMAYARQGRKAQVYRLRGPDGALYALKVFFRGFSPVEYTQISDWLREFGRTEGLRVCRRRLISEDEAAAIGEPGLSCAVLMPWIDGMPWAGVVERRHPLRPETGLALARRTARVLAGLEAQGLAHADVSSTNVIIEAGPAVELIDVEDMYHERFGDVPHVPAGSPGYAHPRHEGESCRNPYGDRFASAVLLAEMLAWPTPAVRRSTSDISVFEPTELGRLRSRYKRVHTAVADWSPALAALFEQAWTSAGWSDCPPLREWAAALDELPAPPADIVRADVDALVGRPHATLPRPTKSTFPGVPTHEGIGFIPLLDNNDAV